MKQKVLNCIDIFWRALQILYLRSVFSIAYAFRREMRINYAAIADCIITSNLTTFVWSGKRCYKVELSNGKVFSGFVKMLPISIDETTTNVTAKFYGVGRVIKKDFSINRKKVSINLGDNLTITLPKSFEVRRDVNNINIDGFNEKIISIPDFTISFPPFINETEETTT